MTALLVAALLAQRPKPLADLPFEHEPGRIWLKAHLNDKTVEAVIDTGAACCVADAEAAKAAGAKAERTGAGGGLGARGVESWATSRLRLSIDGLDATQEVAYAADLHRMGSPKGHSMGALIGGDFLRRFVVEIDYPNLRVRFYDPSSYAPQEGLKAISARFDLERPIVDLYLRLPGQDEQTVCAMLDTGATGLVLTGSYVTRERLLERYSDAKPYAGVGGIGGAASVRLLNGFSAFLANRPFGGGVFLDTAKGGNTGPDAAFDALLGENPLVGGRLVLDYAHSRILVGKSSP